MNMLRDMLQPTRRNMLRGMFTSTSALTRFGINGVEAALALDFIGGEYRTANTSTIFADAFTGTSPKLTYSTAAGSNSTMTQGYGPELVENGDFATDSDWSKDTGWTISDGVATCDGTNAAQLTLANKVTAGSVYQVEFDVTSYTSGNLRVVLGSYGDIVPTITSPGRKTVVQTASSDGSLGFRSASFNGSIDNISVREAPKIVWAPHNLVAYSEDFSQWADHVGLTEVSSTTTDPLGGSTAYTYSGFSGAINNRLSQIFSLAVGVPSTLAIWLKGTAGETIELELDIANAPQNEITFTGDWQLETISNSNPTVGRVRIIYRAGNTADVVSVWGAHVYRSDLGGMHPVPGAVGDFQYYVPTSGNAEYLPRVGHHVYNGSTWVNEGLLIESEPRTNLVTYSTYSGTEWDNTAVTASTTTVPTGMVKPGVLQEDTTTNLHRTKTANMTLTSGTDYTASVFVKNISGTRNIYLNAVQLMSASLNINPTTGVVNSYTSAAAPQVEDAGNGWWRVSWAGVGTGLTRGIFAQLTSLTSSTDQSYLGDGSSSIAVWGFQVEAAPTPSSYMPTSGGTYTRTAQSLTVPPAQFAWPEPEYIGPELVTDFSTYADQNAFDVDWTRGTGWTFSGGVASFSNPAGTELYQSLSLTAGVYAVTATASYTGQAPTVKFNSPGATNTVALNNGTPTTAILVHNGSYSRVSVNGLGNSVVTLDNISVREINPLSVSMQMDGRMTYADTSQYSEVWFTRWYNGSTTNYLYQRLGTNSANTGRPTFDQHGISDGKTVTGDASAYSPGINVPFNIASRHGSTFIRGATDGVLTYLDTPTALPDLSGTNLQIAYDFMGTIGTFRQFAGDIGDAGLVTATNPSTEPTLSLTFDGSEGSFYNLNWSE